MIEKPEPWEFELARRGPSWDELSPGPDVISSAYSDYASAKLHVARWRAQERVRWARWSLWALMAAVLAMAALEKWG